MARNPSGTRNETLNSFLGDGTISQVTSKEGRCPCFVVSAVPCPRPSVCVDGKKRKLCDDQEKLSLALGSLMMFGQK
jgi:hypothetical protein